MSIAGVGIDMVEVARIADAVDRYGRRFLERVFTQAEADYCRSRAVPAQHFAGRFAVKEAVLKALATGWSGGIRWRDIEIRQGPSGRPEVELSGAAARRAEQMGVTRLHVSISHTSGCAVANAIAEGGDG